MLLHLEVQGWRDAGFAEWVFAYNYRVYDRYRRPVASMALLADDSKRWRPDSFCYDLLGCSVRIEFPVVKLLDFADRIDELKSHPNPFALVTAAHLLTHKTRRNAHQRRIAKWALTKLLYQRDWDRQRIIDLYRVIDWMMRLPEQLDARFRDSVLQLDRRNTMPYLTTIERHGMKVGREEGLREGRREGRAELLTEMLTQRFGELDISVHSILGNANEKQLSAWAKNLLEATTLNQVFGLK